jgi:hypothetical protein
VLNVLQENFMNKIDNRKQKKVDKKILGDLYINFKEEISTVMINIDQ